MASKERIKCRFRKTNQNKIKKRLIIKKRGYKMPAKAGGQKATGEMYNAKYENSSNPMKIRLKISIILVGKEIFCFFTVFVFVVFDTW